eukprot:g22646.t1
MKKSCLILCKNDNVVHAPGDESQLRIAPARRRTKWSGFLPHQLFRRALPESDDEEEEQMDHTGSMFVMLERNRFRKVWTGIVTVLLMYIGTWFLFQLTFIDLHKPDPMQVADFLGMNPDVWEVWSRFVDGLFIFDSFIYFFFSFKDEKGREA